MLDELFRTIRYDEIGKKAELYQDNGEEEEDNEAITPEARDLFPEEELLGGVKEMKKDIAKLSCLPCVPLLQKEACKRIIDGEISEDDFYCDMNPNPEDEVA